MGFFGGIMGDNEREEAKPRKTLSELALQGKFQMTPSGIEPLTY